MKKNNRWKIVDTAFYDNLITVALTEFSQVAFSLINSVIAGKMLSTQAIAVIGLGYPIFSIATIVSGLFEFGMKSLGAKEIGRGNFKKYNNIVSIVSVASIIVSLALTGIIFILASPLATLLGARGNCIELHPDTVKYIIGLAIGFPGLIVAPILCSAINLDNGEKLVRISAVSFVLFNVLLDVLMIKWGLGVFGVGLATSLAQYLALLPLFVHFIGKNRSLHFSFSTDWFKTVKEVLLSGLTCGLRRTANFIRPLVLNNFLGIIGGTIGLTIFSIKCAFDDIVLVLCVGIADSVLLLTNMAYSQKNKEEIRRIGHLAHRTNLLGNGLIGLCLFVLAKPLASWYVNGDAALVGLASFVIALLAIEIIVYTFIDSRVNYLNVVNHFLESQILQLGIKLVVLVPIIVIMGNLFGLKGAFGGYLVTYLLLLICVYITDVIKEGKLKPTVDDYLFLDSSCDLDAGQIMEIDIRSPEDAALVSQQLQLFCNGHNLDAKRSLLAALALEESANLIYQHNKSEVVIDVGCTIVQDDLILKIRDNGSKPYPFTAYLNGEDDVANIGLKLVQKIAKDITYTRTLKMNCTIIKL